MPANNIPYSVAKYFWGDDLKDLNLESHKRYIVQTLLEKGNRESLEWLFSHFNKRIILDLLPGLKLSQKSANFWKIYLSV